MTPKISIKPITAKVSEVLSRIDSWYAGISAQEQQILRFGVPLIGLLLIYLVLLQPLGSAYFTRQVELSDRQADLVWIRDQREMLERLNTSCDPRAQVFQADALQTDIEAASRRFGLVPQIRSLAGENHYQLSLSNAQGNRVLNLVRVLACGGASVTSLDIRTADTEVSAVLDIQYGGVGI
jgi:type II secretory pathway component PulM